MLDDSLKDQLKNYLTRLVHPIELVAALDGSESSKELVDLLEEIRSLSDKITVIRGENPRIPSFAIQRPGADISIRFAGLPLGHEFTSLVLALLQVSGYPSKEDGQVLDQVKNLPGTYHFETYYSISCQSCPDVVQALNLMSVINPRVSHVATDGALFQDEVAERQVMAVPSVFLNGEAFSQGRMTLEDIIAKLDTGSDERRRNELTAKEPFEVLVVGGGPAGVAAAVYAARKGIRCGLVAERIGGQVVDTLTIENLIAVNHTEGPQLANVFAQDLKEYEIDVITPQTVTALVPAQQLGGFAELHLANGAILKARSVILSPGARWRKMTVAGEEKYLNKGVAFCPHCDGPLFKGKRVAVIGGGNSGVEAAIDLAGLAESVTLIEFDHQLRADAVLQDKLKSLTNTKVITSALTTEVLGDDHKVTGLIYKNRQNDSSVEISVDGIFVQIGLQPNTEWLKGVIALSPRGEIEVDARCATSLPGIFAGGDATTVPYKQIVVAMGEGAKAALTAFDYLIRNSAP